MRQLARCACKYDGAAGLAPLPVDAPVDPLRLTISTAGTDWTGDKLADTLYARFGVACEMVDRITLVCIVTPADLTATIWIACARRWTPYRVKYSRPHCPHPCRRLPVPRPALSVRRALLGNASTLFLDDVQPGMVCARPVTPYPPGVPVLWPGEEITAEHIVFLRNQCYNTIDRISVYQP